MKDKKITTLLLCLCSIIMQAQQQEVISSSGSYMENSSGSIAMTIGECVTKTHITANSIITQGFHQTNLLPPTVIKELAGLDYEILAYPNPVTESVTLRVEKPQGLYYILYDINGQILEQKEIEAIETEIDFKNLSPSDYIIRIINNDYEVKSFKIVKN
jgi:hypothetical protein